MRVVLDTNVLVAGLLNPYGPPGRIVQMLAAGKLALLFDARILNEYRQVLARPKFPFRPDEIEALLQQAYTTGEPVAPGLLAVPLPDAGDEPFLEVAITAGAEYLVTGNARHFPVRHRHRVRVVSPAKFIEICRGETD